MSIVQTKGYRKMEELRKELASCQHLPPVRYLIYLIDEYLFRCLELEKLELGENILDDKIFCAKKFTELME